MFIYLSFSGGGGGGVVVNLAQINFVSGRVGCFWGVFHFLIRKVGFFSHVNAYHMNIKVEKICEEEKTRNRWKIVHHKERCM